MNVQNRLSDPESPKGLSILHVIAGAGTGGAETFCLDAILALDALAVRQHVICRPHEMFIRALRDRGIPFDVMDFSFRDRIGGGALIAKRCASFGADVVHAWMGRAASFIPRALDKPVAGWFGGYYSLKRYRRCDYFIGITKDVVDHIIRQSGKPHRTFLIPTFGTLIPEEPVDRQSLQTSHDSPVVLLLSRMHWKKGVDTLLHAAALLPDAYFWLAGDGPQKKDYETLAVKLGVQERVRFLGWRQDRAALLRAADVCVLPSRYEPFGTVIAEAWAMQIPLVATKADGARQYVRHEDNGLLCGIDDVDGLAMQIKRAICDTEIRRTIVEGGFRTYHSAFEKNVVTASLIKAYAKMIKTGKGLPDRLLDDDFTQGGTPSDMVARMHRDEDCGSMNDCASVAYDVSALQLGRSHEFLRRNWRGKPTACEIWQAAECDLALENFSRRLAGA